MHHPEVKLPKSVRVIQWFEKNDYTLPIVNDDDVPPAATIAPFVEMTVRQTAETMANLRNRHLLPTPKPENTKARMSVGVSSYRGGKWLELKRYAFMAPEEADFALTEKLGEEKKSEMGLDKASIRRVLAKHKVAGHIKRTDEERKSIWGTIHEPKEVKKDRAIFWVRLADLLDQQGIKSPDNRMVWVDIWQRAEDVIDGVGLVLERLAQGQNLHFVMQQILERETQALEDSFSDHLKNNFVADEKDQKVFKEFAKTIKRITSMPLTLAEKERLFRCLFWEEKGGEAYAKFFIVPSNKLGKDLGQLIDDTEQLRIRYDTLWTDEKD